MDISFELYKPRRENKQLVFAVYQVTNNKGADQLVLLHSLISTFALHILEIIIAIKARSEILSNFWKGP